MDGDQRLLGALLAAVVFGPMLFRLSRPTPQADQEAITLFLKNRDQTLIEMKKLWFGGPGRFGRGIYTQYGRPYRLLSRSPDASRWTHKVVMLDEVDSLGSPKMMHWLQGAWVPAIQ